MLLYLSFLNSYGAENLAQSNRRIPRLMMPGSWYDRPSAAVILNV